MALPSRFCWLSLVAVFPLSLASGQEAETEIIPFIPLAPPSQEPAPPSAANEELAQLEAAFEIEIEAWYAQLNAMDEHDGFEGPFSVGPAEDYYPKFRAFADDGHISARLWCLQNFFHDKTPEPHRRQLWLGEALSLATAVRNDEELWIELYWSLYTGWQYGEDTIEEIKVYLQETTQVEAIRRKVMTRRATDMLTMSEGKGDLARAIAGEVQATWPDSLEARELARLVDAMKTLVLGGIPADFTGEDVDGNEISLYDYRGKVVLIDFWGFW